VRVGLRHDTHIIQLSSDAAHEHWKEVAELATNITRVDLEVTFELEQVEHGFIRRNFELMRQHHAGRGRARNLSVIENTVKGCTLYAGARSSDIYARGYDKGAESKTMEKGKLFRQELEMKRQLAKDIVVELQTADSVPLYCASVVSSHFRKLGAETSNVIESNRKSARACQPSNDCQRLRWLGSAVAPSVRLLLSKGKHVEVARALGLDEAALLLLLQAVKAQTKGDEDNGSTEAI
jgi:DNA relaxase NicK